MRMSAIAVPEDIRRHYNAFMISDQQKMELADYFSRQPVDAVYLFGSQATGKVRAGSDVDIAVLFRSDVDRNTRFDLRLQFTSTVGRMTGHPDHAEIVDLDEAPLPIRFAAIRYRHFVVEHNHNHAVFFDADTRSRYFDYTYHLMKELQQE